MKILLTGASGFLGSVILDELRKEHIVDTLGRSMTDHLQYDITRPINILGQYDMVIHSAGKAHVVPKSEEEKKEFMRVNAEGTQHLLNSLEENPPETFVFISTVAVYGKEAGILIDEEEEVLPNSAYGKSKYIAEQKVIQFGKDNQCSSLILRLPLVVGARAPGNLGAMQTAIRRGYYFRLGKGDSCRSMVLARDIARLIPSWKHRQGIYHLTDGCHPTFADIENQIALFYHKKIKSLPLPLLQMMAKMGDIIPVFPLNSYRLKKLTSTLTFSDEKARREIGWLSHAVLEDNSWLNEA